MQRASVVVRQVWAAYPVYGIVLLFAIVGVSAYASFSARASAKEARAASAANAVLINERIADKDRQLSDKDKVIADKDAQLQAKDQALAGQTSIIGQLYGGAIALQEQVRRLGGAPKSIPITIPSPGKVSPSKSFITPGPTSTPTAASTTKPSAADPCALVDAPLLSGTVHPTLKICPPGKG